MAGYYENIVDQDYYDEAIEEEFFRNNTCVTAKDSLISSINERGRVDLSYMTRISSIPKEEIIEELEGTAIWLDPQEYLRTEDYEQSFVVKSQLLRGNIVKKYELAMKMNDETGFFDRTATLLKENLPEVTDAGDIHINMGATWIPVDIIVKFIQTLFNIYVPPKIERDEFQGKYTLDFPMEPGFITNFTVYGTGRMRAVSIIKHILNAVPIKVYDQVYNPNKKNPDNVLNKAETLAAQEKERIIREEWQKYIYSDDDIKKRLEEEYYRFWGYSISKFDGSFLTLDDLNKEITPYRHQKDAIAHILFSQNVLLAHDVGAGKTLEYACGAHELLRIGLVKKVMIIVPNNTFEATANAYKQFYKDDRVLAVYPTKDFKPQKREDTLNKIVSDEYQVIIMAYSSFDMITLSRELALKNLKDQYYECTRVMNEVKNYATRKSLKAKRDRIIREIQKKEEELHETPEPVTACFEKLGVDMLVVDECHNYKNITLENMTDSIVGMHNSGSKKADEMLKKVSYIQSIGGRVVFATGTPITNSLADIYVLQRYLQPDELKICKIDHFNEWVNTYCSQESIFEVDVDSKNYRYTTRFSKFHNLPELMSMFSEVCDFYQIDSETVGLPDFDGYEDTLVRKSKEQREYINDLALRTEKIRAHEVDRVDDNLLKITVDGRKCALDVRLVSPKAIVSSSESKVGVCAANIYKIYVENPGTTQVAFCDISTPKDDFNIYDELKSDLISKGMPSQQIAFIHDAVTEAKRTKLEEAFNEGRIRLLIGSTTKLGTGCNVQERLIAAHHLDVPWRPSDMVQREGRIIRQGNTCEKVYVFRYVTEASFDSYSWQILENKQRFIAQFLSGSLNAVHRDETDCTDTVLTYAEIKALAIGNPLIKRRVELANDIEQAKIKQREKRKELIRLADEVSVHIPKKMANLKKRYVMAKADFTYYKSIKEAIPKTERIAFGEELLEEVRKCNLKSSERLFDIYQGFGIYLPEAMNVQKPYILVRREDSNTYTIRIDDDTTPLGCSMKIDYLLDHLDKTAEDHMKAMQQLNKQRNQAEEVLDKGNEYDIQIQSLKSKLAIIDRRLEEGSKNE